jgi:hypothetical protein
VEEALARLGSDEYWAPGNGFFRKAATQSECDTVRGAVKSTAAGATLRLAFCSCTAYATAVGCVSSAVRMSWAVRTPGIFVTRHTAERVK